MAEAKKNWGLIRLRPDGRQDRIPFPEGTLTVGRDKDNSIPIKDVSVSRFHAGFELSNDEVTVRDLGAKNGILVNGVMRSDATLQADDEISIGNARFQVVSGAMDAAVPKPSARLEPESDALLQTALRPLNLPSGPAERQLAMLYHGCSWLASDLAEDEFAIKCLRTIREGMSPVEAQYYDEKGRLQHTVFDEEEGRTGIRLAAYLAERFKNVPEAVIINGGDIKFHQRNIKDFNYLVGTLCPDKAERGNYPFIVLIKPTAWKEFDIKDRLLLQALCQLWHRRAAADQKIHRLNSENKKLKQTSGAELIGSSKALEKLRTEAAKAAATRFTVTLMGETGSGKEVAAHFIHASSPRADGPFIRVNCAAIPHSLMENELFGHVKGSFTDARTDQKGKFELADGGTLFLDEVGELPLELQAKMLRALESGEIEKIGSEKPLHVDVRVIAATNRNLKRMSDEKTFREDLYFRLTPLMVRIPPLREHVEDIEEIAQRFLDQFTAEYGAASFRLDPRAIKVLQKHPWPGNVRELKHVMQRCALGADDAVISASLVKDKLEDATP